MTYNEATEKLKPCPFCGSSGKFYITTQKSYEELRDEDERGFASISITCEKCHASLPEFGFWEGITDYNERLDMAIKKWNERAMS